MQPAFAERAQQELVSIAQQAGRSSSDFKLLSGDITEPNLGLSPADLETARAESTILFHLAAIYDLAVARELAIRVNVEGTRNVNEFARSLPACVTIITSPPAMSPENAPAGFWRMSCSMMRAFATTTKKQSIWRKLEVEALKSELPITIHRPAVVCGDSRIGRDCQI